MDTITPATDIAEITTDQPKGWRAHLAIHPAAELFPLMGEAELRELGENIKARGGLVQAIHLYKGKLLDGRNRLDAMELVGLLLDDTNVRCLAHDLPHSIDPYEYVIAANLHRRHLTADQRRELIAKVLKAKPEASNRQVAKQVKADDKTVAKVRHNLEARAEIPHVETRTDSKGRQQPSTKQSKQTSATVTPAEAATTADGIIAEFIFGETPDPAKPAANASKQRNSSKQNLEWFAVACREYLPNITIEAHRQEARRLVAELTQAGAAS